MTYDQYWEQDSDLVKYYRKAQEIRLEEQNRLAWLQGMYVYEAIADIAPILHAFAKKGTRAREYSKKPYEFQKPEKKPAGAGKQDKEAKAKAERIKGMMFAAMNQHNAENAKKRIEEMKRKQAAMPEGAPPEPGTTR